MLLHKTQKHGTIPSGIVPGGMAVSAMCAMGVSPMSEGIHGGDGRDRTGETPVSHAGRTPVSRCTVEDGCAMDAACRRLWLERIMMSRHAPMYKWLSAGLQGAALLALLCLTGCPRTEPETPTTGMPLQVNGVPVVRVLVESGPSIRVGTSGSYRIFLDGRQVAASGSFLRECELSRQGAQWILGSARYAGTMLKIEARVEPWDLLRQGFHVSRSCVRIGNCYYRGAGVFLPDSARGIMAVNYVDIESYLAAVLPKELYASWHPTTYQALAIIARTYAMYEIATTGRGKLFDVNDDQSSQCYGGFSAETDKSWRAVRSTHAMVLAWGPPGKEKIFSTKYSSCCGGITNNIYVMNGQFSSQGPMCGGVVCNDCQNSTKFRWPAVAIPKDVVCRAAVKCYPNMTGLTALQTIVVEEVLGERPVWISLVSVNGQKYRIRAEDLRLALLRDGDARAKNLFSMNCTIRDQGNMIVFDNGHGFGHGVGLCQWGAEGKAQRGVSATQILADYYPGAKLYKSAY